MLALTANGVIRWYDQTRRSSGDQFRDLHDS
jgi:hypothetical protein